MAAVFHLTTKADTVPTNPYPSNSFTPTAGRLLVVLVTVSGSVVNGTCTASANGITFTFVLRAIHNTSTNSTMVYVANQLTPASPSAMTVTVDVTADPGTGAVVHVAEVSGMTNVGAAAIRQSTKQDNGAGATTPAPVFGSAVLTGNPTMVVLGQISVNPTTAPVGWTKLGEGNYSTPTIGSAYVARDSGFTGTTITWGTTSTAFGDVAIELDASAPASSMSPASRRAYRASARRGPVPEFRGIFVAEIPWQQTRPIKVQRSAPGRRPQRFAVANFVAPPPAQQPTPPAFVPGRQRERVRLAAYSKSRLEFVPVPVQAPTPPAFVPGVQGRDRVLRGWLSRRSRRVAAFPTSDGPTRLPRRGVRGLSSRRPRRIDVPPTPTVPVAPALVPQATMRRALRSWPTRRADRVETVPAQVVATPPTLVGRATMRRALRGWLARRADRVEVVPAPVTPVAPAHIPDATGRRTIRGWIARKTRRPEIVPPQAAPAAPAFVPQASRRRMLRLLTRRARPHWAHVAGQAHPTPARPPTRRPRALQRPRTRLPQPVPAQVIVVAPKLVGRASQRRTLRGWIRRPGRYHMPVQPGAFNLPARGDLDPHGLGDLAAHPGQPVRPHPSMPPSMRRGAKLTRHSQSGGVDLR